MKISSIASKLRDLSLYGAVLLLSGFTMLAAGGAAFADDASCATPASSVHPPAGADAGTFTYQCSGPNAGKWTNPYYVYNPATGSRSALYTPDYRYDCNAKAWTMAQWDYSPSSGRFVQSRIAPSTAPNLPTGCAAAAPSTPVASSPSSSSGSTGSTSSTPTTTTSGTGSSGVGGDSASDPPGSASTNGDSTVANTGPHSRNSAKKAVTLHGIIDNTNKIGASNAIANDATTGNTSVVGNTTGGSATTGDAQSVTNVANLLQSSNANAFSPNTAVFTSNIDGDVNGDFMFDPTAILASGPGSANSTNNNLQINTNNTNDTNAQINNNIDAGATSGNATVAGNTTAGNATSGNAGAVVNLMNLINSTVASGQSFVGTININGDLNGDILLPQGVLDQLLASSGPSSTNSANTNLTNTSNTTNNVTEAVANNIKSSAQTGTATVSGNTTGGNATSGNSGTNVTLLNLTGSNTVGKDDLLVFVNVLGKWVGMIMNAPSGSSAAELGGGITANTGPGSSNSTNTTEASNSTTTNNAKLGITNNVNVHARSGDAGVTNNTTGGNAKTGNANTAVNVLNLEGSNLALSDWFGVLFINVFGVWNGSFGVNTSAGDPVVSNPASPTNNPVQAATQQAFIDSFHQLTNFAPHGHGGVGGGSRANVHSAFGPGSSTGSGASSNSGSNTDDGNNPDFENAAILGSSSALSNPLTSSTTAHHPTADNAAHAGYTLPIFGFCLAALILLAGERDRLFRSKQ
jgi:hypothetical protein